MVNRTEAEERGHLGLVLEKLRLALRQVVEEIEGRSDEIIEKKRYIYENLAQLDAAEKAANRMAVYDSVTLGERAVRVRQQLEKLMDSPYFGRIDLTFADEGEGEEVFYIGLHAFAEDLGARNLIFDWRAPISSIFYDCEVGPARYQAPGRVVEADLHRKRQYRIRQSQMEYMIESSLSIGDEVLQRELRHSADDRMKNIVATIQREQNTVIRDEQTKVLIIQGAAGSGKTSIALHRVAFLLYRFGESLAAKDVLILSPNKVFGSYISNVLPELGEENVPEIPFDEVADRLLGRKYAGRYQSFAQQVEGLLAGEDEATPARETNVACEAAVTRIRHKSTNEFVEALHAFLRHAEATCFTPADLRFGAFSASRAQVQSGYRAFGRMPVKKRLRKIADNLIDGYQRSTGRGLEPGVARQIREAVAGMFPFSDSLALYREFYRHTGQGELFQMAGKNTLEYCDVYPLCYVKLFFEGAGREYRNVKHLLVDEMQDYTPIQYAVLSQLFSCRMTILGDSHQSVNPYSSSSAQRIEPFFPGCRCVELRRSYRSTLEISEFAGRILENKDLIPTPRHGPEPQVLACADAVGESAAILGLVEEYRASGFTSLGILCRSAADAQALHQELLLHCPGLRLLDGNSREFMGGMVVTSVHLSKGLEFDQVVVPGVSQAAYRTEMDRSLLYIACTRAMHRLDLTCTGAASRFLTP